MLRAFSATAAQPPAAFTPKKSTMTSASVITMDWIRLVTEAAMKPPSAQ